MYERREKSLLSINQHHGVQFRYICIVQISDNNILGLFFATRSVHAHCKKKKINLIQLSLICMYIQHHNDNKSNCGKKVMKSG